VSTGALRWATKASSRRHALPGRSLLDATILTAVTTVVLAVGAIITAMLACPACRKQSREVQPMRLFND